MQCRDIQIIEVPVYRITRSMFRKETDHLVTDAIADNFVTEDTKQRIRAIYSYPYLYNEVIGWVRVFIDSVQIRGEYYFVGSKNIRRGFKKNYHHGGKAFEMATFTNQDSHEIYINLLNRLKQLNSERPFVRRFIDLESFENIGKHVNWRALIDENLNK